MVRKFFFPVFIVALLSIMAALPALASEQSADAPDIQPSNYCQSCHSSGDSRIENPTAWVGGIAHNQISPCPADRQIQEEIYYTERLLLAIDRAREKAPAGVDMSKSDARLAAAGQYYSRLLDAPVTSLEAFSAEARMVRFRLGKVYTAINQVIEFAKRERVTWTAVGVSVVLLASLGWGWLNARKAISSSSPALFRGFKFYANRAIFLILVFILFALPIFRLPSQAVTITSAEEQERQAAIDESGRAARTADRELSRAWMLAQIGAVWKEANPDIAETILEEALDAADEAQFNAASLWGLSQAAREAGRAETEMQAKAALVASDLDAVRSRAWGLRLIAEAWLDVDAEKAEGILQKAVEQAESAVTPYGQLDVRAIAVTWAQIDKAQGIELAQRISDPAIRSWALREIAVVTNDSALFEKAAEAARMVAEPIQQARLLRELAAVSGDSSLFGEAAAALEWVAGLEQALALADLAGASREAAFADQISTEYPVAQALAYYYLKDYETAWQAAKAITDPFEQARAQAAIAGEWGDADAALKIDYALMRDRALRDISLITGNPSLVEDMQDSYYQVQTLTAFGQFEDAWQYAEGLNEGYPLVAFGLTLADDDPQAAAEVLNTLTREADKAVVLRAIAASTGTPDDFENALGMALAARTSGNALAPAKASLALAEIFADSPELFEKAVDQAYEIVQIINIKY